MIFMSRDSTTGRDGTRGSKCLKNATFISRAEPTRVRYSAILCGI